MNDVDLAETLLALGGVSRVRLLRLLHEKRLRCSDPCGCDLSERCCTVSEVADGLGVSLATASHHLRELRRAGLITTRREGRFVYCALNPERLRLLAGLFAALGGGARPETRTEEGDTP